MIWTGGKCARNSVCCWRCSAKAPLNVPTPTATVTNAEQWLAANARPPADIELGLARVEAVRQCLPLSLAMPLITVGGTNGKGSVCALLNALLTAGGWTVGCYTSPHIRHFGERIRVADRPLSDEVILDALQTVDAARQKAAVELTYFELTTLAAALLFAEQSCDIVVLEVGLGGRLDAVNVFAADVTVITNVAMDHCEFLGNDRNAIAVEKAGICRPQQPTVVGDDEPPPALLTAMKERQALPHRIGDAFHAELGQRCWHYHGIHRTLNNLPLPALSGRHQLSNAACALAALELLGNDYWPGSGAVRLGLHSVELPGRLQVLPGKPTTVLDVAHNVAAAAAVERFLFDMGYYPQTRAVFGINARKDIGGFVACLAKRIDAWYVACPAGGDVPAATIADSIRAVCPDAVVQIFPSIAAASQQVAADSDESDRILVTGSFLTVADYMADN